MAGNKTETTIAVTAIPRDELARLYHQVRRLETECLALTAERDALRERVQQLEARPGVRIRVTTRCVKRVRAVSVGNEEAR